LLQSLRPNSSIRLQQNRRLGFGAVEATTTVVLTAANLGQQALATTPRDPDGTAPALSTATVNVHAADSSSSGPAIPGWFV
jgi:hypothetical protein